MSDSFIDVEDAYDVVVSAPKRRRPSAQTASLGGTDQEGKIVDFSLGREIKKSLEQVFITRNEAMVEALSQVPIAFVEPQEKSYTQDAVDRLLPAPGFLTDFVNTGRGMESPTLFFVWNCLWLISTVMKREAWLRWYPGKLWPNLYVILVAPPSLCRKSSSLNIATSLLRDLPHTMPDSLEAYKKDTKIITGKTTPEGLLGTLVPEKRVFLEGTPDGGTGRMVTVEKGSQVAISISEFATFLGKQQYTSGMVNLLTDLFDCQDTNSEITRGRGDIPLKDIYVTLMAAITPDGLKLSIPEEAFGGGFMSRLMVAYQDVPTKIYSIPKAIEGYPTVDDLRTKLAWIALNARGEYYLTPEAFQYYDEWYHKWKASLFAQGMENKEEFRTDSLMLRTALLLRAQEYRVGQDITLENIKTAKRLVEYTTATAKRATEDVGATRYQVHLNAIKRVLQRRGEMTRRQLSQFMSPRGATSQEISQVVEQLAVEGFLKIRLAGSILEQSSGRGNETYELMEERV